MKRHVCIKIQPHYDCYDCNFFFQREIPKYTWFWDDHLIFLWEIIILKMNNITLYILKTIFQNQMCKKKR